jgi:hypothetical protein
MTEGTKNRKMRKEINEKYCRLRSLEEEEDRGERDRKKKEKKRNMKE